MNYGDLIKKHREIKNINREQMSGELEIALNTYKKIESNQREPTLRELTLISQKLKIDPSEFFPDITSGNISAGDYSPGVGNNNVITIQIDRDSFNELALKNPIKLIFMWI